MLSYARDRRDELARAARRDGAVRVDATAGHLGTHAAKARGR
jgi:hypothetical protein